MAAGTVYVTSADACCAAGLAAYRATDGRLLWVRRVPGVSSMAAPAVANGVVFTTSDGTSCCAHTDFGLWALDGSTGRPLWVRYPPLNASTYPPGVHDTPSVAGGVVYAGGQDAYTTTGRRVWINDAPHGLPTPHRPSPQVRSTTRCRRGMSRTAASAGTGVPTGRCSGASGATRCTTPRPW